MSGSETIEQDVSRSEEHHWPQKPPIMSKKRGLSLDEKRAKVLNIFHDTKDVFVYKDIEKLAPKQGVVLQSVKEVLQSLVDDDLVHVEKMGSSNFYWSFPNEAVVKLETGLEKVTEQAQNQKNEREELEARLQLSREGKEDSGDRQEKMQALLAIEARCTQLKAQLAQYAESDPDRFTKIKEATVIARDSANRWLDNLEVLKSWLMKRFEGQEESLKSFFKECGYKEDWDFLE